MPEARGLPCPHVGAPALAPKLRPPDTDLVA